jgi:hypothetical protein
VVIFIATDGTIAKKIDTVKHAPVPAISGEDLLARRPKSPRWYTQHPHALVGPLASRGRGMKLFRFACAAILEYNPLLS